MLSVIAEQTARIEPNAKRRRWLEAFVREYMGYYGEVVNVIEKHSRFRGDKP